MAQSEETHRVGVIEHDLKKNNSIGLSQVFDIVGCWHQIFAFPTKFLKTAKGGDKINAGE